MLHIAALLQHPKELFQLRGGQQLGQFTFTPGFAQPEFLTGLLTNIQKFLVIQALFAGQLHELRDDGGFRFFIL